MSFDRPLLRRLHALHGGYLVLAAVMTGAFAWVVSWFVGRLVETGAAEGGLPPLVLGVAERRGLTAAAAAPALLCGLLLILRVRPRWLWAALGTLGLLVPAALLIYVFVAAISVLYQTPEL